MIYRLANFFGGVGDSLQHSTLPQMLTEAGHEVYLLKDPNNMQVKPYRNNQIKEFVWGDNKYIKGEMEGLWNAGDLLNLYQNSENNFIRNWEKVHGLEPKNSFPKIYRVPNKIRGIEGILELSGISLTYNEQQVKRLVESIMVQFPGISFHQIVSPNQSNRIHIQKVANMQVNNLWELWDVLGSTKVFLSLNSGSHSMAAACREYNKTLLHYSILPDDAYQPMMDLKRFIYPSISYLKEGSIF